MHWINTGTPLNTTPSTRYPAQHLHLPGPCGSKRLRGPLRSTALSSSQCTPPKRRARSGQIAFGRRWTRCPSTSSRAKLPSAFSVGSEPWETLLPSTTPPSKRCAGSSRRTSRDRSFERSCVRLAWTRRRA